MRTGRPGRIVPADGATDRPTDADVRAGRLCAAVRAGIHVAYMHTKISQIVPLLCVLPLLHSTNTSAYYLDRVFVGKGIRWKGSSDW